MLSAEQLHSNFRKTELLKLKEAEHELERFQLIKAKGSTKLQRHSVIPFLNC